MSSTQKPADKLPADRLIDQFDALPQADPQKALAEELSRAALERRRRPEERDSAVAAGKPYLGRDRRKQQPRPAIAAPVRQAPRSAATSLRRRNEEAPQPPATRGRLTIEEVPSPPPPNPGHRGEDSLLKTSTKPTYKGRASQEVSELELTLKV